MEDSGNLVAKKALGLIKENSEDREDYKNNLIKSISLLGDELKKDTCYLEQEKEIYQYIKNNEAENIYKIIKAGAKDYDMDMLIDEVIKIENADYILSSVVLWKNKKITKTHFLKCAKALVDLKAVEEIVNFSKYCFGDNTFYNSYNIVHDLVKLMEEDIDLMVSVVKYIDRMKAKQGNTPSCYMPYGTCVTTEMRKFRDILYSKIYSQYLKNKREV